MFWTIGWPEVVKTGRRNQNYVAKVALEEKKINFFF